MVKGESLSYRARFVASGGNVGGAGIGVGVRGVEGAVPSSSSSSSSTNDNSSNYGSYIAADREFNAKEIAKAAMGSYSVVDVSVATPNRFSCLLAPPSGTGDLISVVSFKFAFLTFLFRDSFLDYIVWFFVFVCEHSNE